MVRHDDQSGNGGKQGEGAAQEREDMKAKPYRMSIKLTSSDMNEDIHIQLALKQLFSQPSFVRVCFQRLNTGYIYPISYRLTVWYYTRDNWTEEMLEAQSFWGCDRVERDEMTTAKQGLVKEHEIRQVKER